MRKDEVGYIHICLPGVYTSSCIYFLEEQTPEVNEFFSQKVNESCLSVMFVIGTIYVYIDHTGRVMKNIQEWR